ncbi:sugar phosphate isomerase/epimerase (plasmid) [Embleya sp. NBC_00888]|uniref:sugar phosphate isomerase/epimerase family protein n=1 Tax=Embleya sp. NBC_00888 TaxID=2975960 RepID=UPI002F908A16|nr:sugar phosphate isomerase/epimerase [Embleya sp. NBC_00888]
MRIAYGTNGFADHRIGDVLEILADLGYDGVALTLDHHHLDPFTPGLASRVAGVATRLDRLGLSVVVETGARYLLDPWRKHRPTLLDDTAGADRRVDLLERAVRVAAELGAPVVSLWSGRAPRDVDPRACWERLTAGCSRVLTQAHARGVSLGFEPEPGMFVDTLDRYEELWRRLGRPEHLGLTLDIGHCRCLEPLPVPDCVARAGPHLVNVQIEDMRRGVHEHLEFGHGDIDFPPVLHALADTGYDGLVGVELPRHSHAATETARRSIAFLRAVEKEIAG